VRGGLGRCPACGRGRILRGYISPIAACAACGEDLAPYQTADLGPYLVSFAIGLTFTPLAVAIALNPAIVDWIIWPLIAAALALAALLLPRAKGAAIGLLWALDIRA